MAIHQALDLPAVIANRYRALRLLGQGGMGRVYEVEHLRTGQRLALKLMSLSAGASVERFKREARATSRITSDHVVRVVDADVWPELGNAPFLVTELLEGSDLARAAATEVALPPAEALSWLRQIARGLDRAHGAGIIHRDLKPENLFLTQREDGSPLIKILDFGISRATNDDANLTGSDHFIGTPGYMAPEQADSSAGAVTHRADLYALGLVAHRLLTGKNYFKPGSLSQYLSQLLAERMAPPSERGSTLGPGFDGWFMRACSRAPEERFESGAVQIEALALVLQTSATAQVADGVATARSLSSIPVVSMPTPTASIADVPADTSPKPASRLRLAAAGALLLAVGALAASSLRAVRARSPVAEIHSAGTPPESFGMPAPRASLPVASASPRGLPQPLAQDAGAPPLASVEPQRGGHEPSNGARSPRPGRAPHPSATRRPVDPLEDQY